MAEHNVSCLLVCGNNTGFLTTEGVGRAVARADFNNKVKYYTEKFIVVKTEISLFEVFIEMCRNNVKIAMVNEKPIGVVTTHTIFEKMVDYANLLTMKLKKRNKFPSLVKVG